MRSRANVNPTVPSGVVGARRATKVTNFVGRSHSYSNCANLRTLLEHLLSPRLQVGSSDYRRLGVADPDGTARRIAALGGMRRGTSASLDSPKLAIVVAGSCHVTA